MRTYLAAGALGLVVSGAIACDGAAPAGSWAGSITDSAGISIVTSRGPGIWAESEQWLVEPDLRIGEFGGDPRYQFGQIGSLALNGVGNILVVDRQAREVREFTAQGEYVRTIGSPGQGPGQFERGVTDIFLTKGDTLLVPDVRNRRVHRFAPDGSLLDAVSLDIGKYRVLRSRWSAVRAEGVMQVRPAASESEDQPNDELRVVNSDGSLGAVLLSLPRGGLFEPGGALRYFTPEPMWGVTDSLTVMYGVTGEYRLGLYDRGGALRTVIAREHMPRPITDRDIRAFFAYLDRAWLANGARPDQLRANRQRVRFAETFPAFSAVHQGPQGTIWVQRVQAPGDLSDERIELYNFIEDFGAADWDVFDAAGRLLGMVRMPLRFQPRLFVGDAIYGVVRDEFDVQYAVRVRVVTP